MSKYEEALFIYFNRKKAYKSFENNKLNFPYREKQPSKIFYY